MLLFVEQVAIFGKFFDHALAGRKSIHADEVTAGQLVESAVRVEYVDHGQIMPLGDLEVEPVMSGSNLENARAKVLFHRLVRNDGDRLRVYGAGGVLAFEILPTRGSSGWIAKAASPIMVSGRVVETSTKAPGVSNSVFDPVEGTVLRLHDHLFVGKRRQACRTPVDHPLAPVDVSFLEEFDKGLNDGLGIVVVKV